VETPTDDGTDYYRWSVDLPNGEYRVWLFFEVGEDYFCPDSHYTMEDLRREADQAGASVWKGEVRSNEVQLVHA
jgi:hypothetical protein